MNFDYRGRPAIGWHLSLDCLGDLSELGVESIALNPRLNAECAKSAEAWSHFKLHHYRNRLAGLFHRSWKRSNC
jgi:hypothetical protein